MNFDKIKYILTKINFESHDPKNDILSNFDENPEKLLKELMHYLKRMRGGHAVFNKNLIKSIVFLYPENTKYINRILSWKQKTFDYDLHFSLFCIIDKIQFNEYDLMYKKYFLKIIGDYLFISNTDQGKAAWMAADLLGDHWELSESITVLLNISLNSKFRFARKNSLHGLYKAYNRTKDPNLISIISYISHNDRSIFVKEYCTYYLKLLN